MLVSGLALLSFYLFIYIYLFCSNGNGKVLRSLFTFPGGFAINVFSQMLFHLTYITKSDRKLQCIKIVKRLVKYIVDSLNCFIFASVSYPICKDFEFIFSFNTSVYKSLSAVRFTGLFNPLKCIIMNDFVFELFYLQGDEEFSLGLYSTYEFASKAMVNHFQFDDDRSRYRIRKRFVFTISFVKSHFAIK